MTTIRPADPDPVGTLKAAFDAIDERICAALEVLARGRAERQQAQANAKRRRRATPVSVCLKKRTEPMPAPERESKWAKMRQWAKA